MDNLAIKNKIIEIIEEAGFSSRIETAIRLMSSDSPDVIWFGYEGFENCAFMVDDNKVVLWINPELNENTLLCAFDVSYDNIMIRLKNFDEENFRKIVSDLKEKTIGVLKDKKKLLKEERIKMIEGL